MLNRARDDAGVVAVIVALALSTFLLGFAALAVDLGTTYARRSEIRALAERLALAAADGLPDVAAARAEVRDSLAATCATSDLPGVCDAPAAWMSDGTAGNGEVTFYADQGQAGDLADLDRDGHLTAGDALRSPGQAAGVRVDLPPAQVPFGLAGAIGIDGTTVRGTATARIGTPLGSGVLPFGLNLFDLGRGQFCVRDPNVDGSGGSLCDGLTGLHGFLSFARPGQAGVDALTTNIRSSPKVKLYPSNGLLGTVGEALNCVSQLFSPATTCASEVFTRPFSAATTAGLFTAGDGEPGRMEGDCGSGTTSSGPYSGIDGSHLLSDGSPLVDVSKGSGSQLRSFVLSGHSPGVAQRGWVTSRALRCPRLVVLPVLDPNPFDSLLTGQRIVRLTYAWIDSSRTGRGFGWDGDRLRSVSGYVIDPRLLPETVAGSPLVGPYLGPDMPKEAVLITDLPDS